MGIYLLPKKISRKGRIQHDKKKDNRHGKKFQKEIDKEVNNYKKGKKQKVRKQKRKKRKHKKRKGREKEREESCP